MESILSKVRLDLYNNYWYEPGSKVKICFWMLISSLFFKNSLPIPSKIKVIFLRLFGARVGKGVVIKPSVSIKYPWNLYIGDNSWIGEDVWIDNLVLVKIEPHACVSQGALLLTGNHDFTKPNFDLLVGEIHIKSGAWVGAKSIVCPGVTLHSHTVLAVGSVATRDLTEYSIYQGNPATKKKDRIII